MGEVYNDVTGAAGALTKALGKAVDEKTILELAQAAVKYALPIGIIIALLYGGKKLIDKVMSESINLAEGQEDLDYMLRIIKK